ncbi:retrovirus-related pol polyprotein from transposon TNT 1-94, partial [Tanacetum coccineum]
MSSQTSTPSVSIEKFNGKSNFSLWRIKVRALLKQQGIWAPLAGPKLADMTDAKYNSQDEKAHSTILLSLSDEVLYEVADEKTAAGVWKKLEKLYMTKSLTNKLLLKQLKIDDKDAALILLVSLPPSFENFVNSFVVGKDTITLEDVRSSLHSRELRHQASGTLESQPVGLSVAGQDRGRHQTQKSKGKGGYKDRSKSRPRGSNPRDTCNYCKEEGHWKFNCPKLKEKGQVAAVAKDDSGSERDAVLSVVDYKGTPLVWIMDSACSFNIVTNQDWFVTYERDRSFWAEALNTACYLINRSPATAIDNKTPIEVWSGKPTHYLKLRVFGCPAYYHVSEGKLVPIGEKGIFMGYSDGFKGYRIWSPSERRFSLSQDVTFDEDYLFRVKQDPIES